MWPILILQALASAFNAVMDKNQFHYRTSVFAHWASKDNKWGWFWAGWSGPDAWRNKYLQTGSRIGDLLQRTVFVWMTDVWHAAQFGMFTVYQIGFSVLLTDRGYMLGCKHSFIAAATWVLILKTLHGAIFNPLFHKILDKPVRDKSKNSFTWKRHAK